MPRNPIDYSKTVFYKIVCKDPAITDCYVGMTTNLAKRKAAHRKNMRATYGYSNADCYVYHFIREHGGRDNWDFVVLEEGSFETKNAAHARERHWLEQEGASLNCIMPMADRPRQQTAEQAAVRNAKETCACGGTYTYRNKNCHMNSLKHLAWVAAQEGQTDNENSDENV